MLNEPLPGESRAAATPAESDLEADADAFMAAMQSLGGG